MVPAHREKQIFESIRDSVKEIDVFYGLEENSEIHFGTRVVFSSNINPDYIRVYKPKLR